MRRDEYGAAIKNPEAVARLERAKVAYTFKARMDALAAQEAAYKALGAVAKGSN